MILAVQLSYGHLDSFYIFQPKREMEERERPRERVSEGDGEESWFEGANGESEGYLKVGGRKRRFGVESN